jgi:hypothetical protein
MKNFDYSTALKYLSNVNEKLYSLADNTIITLFHDPISRGCKIRFYCCGHDPFSQGCRMFFCRSQLIRNVIVS